jgi:hypothetical protein
MKLLLLGMELVNIRIDLSSLRMQPLTTRLRQVN